jgi:hypothetical protein
MHYAYPTIKEESYLKLLEAITPILISKENDSWLFIQGGTLTISLIYQFLHKSQKIHSTLFTSFEFGWDHCESMGKLGFVEGNCFFLAGTLGTITYAG